MVLFLFFFGGNDFFGENEIIRKIWQFCAIIGANLENAFCGGADAFLRAAVYFHKKKGITMKNLTLAIRAVYAAFVRVLCAIPASFLNLKGGGGQKLATP